jgi:predicted TIM-barrel fold metal-dependent hydrolase
MYFDFHTHIFPDKIAGGAVAHLIEKAEAATGEKDCLTAHTDGTLEDLKRSMERGGIDGSLVLPVCTNPKQFESINKFAAEINGREGIYSFGGIHPDCEDIEGKLDYIKSLGLKGVKLHPAYQNCFIDDARNLRIAEHCMKIGLYCLFHAGYDIAYPDIEFCPPDRFAKAFTPLLEKYNEEEHPHIILAHLGGVMSLEGTLDHLCGLPIYMDTAYTLDKVSTNMLMKVIRSHGADKILFGSDSPWQSQRKSRERLASLPISKKEFEDISYGNAKKILSL